MNPLEQKATDAKSNAWLAIVIPLIVGGLTMPLIPNLAGWLFTSRYPEHVAADFWNRVAIYVAVVRWSGIVLLVAGIWLAVRQVLGIKHPAANPDCTSESN